MSFLVVKNLSKSYRRGLKHEVKALERVNFYVKKGEFFVILGPSGCGKSTLLNLIAGLEKPDGGQIFINGAEVSSTDFVLPPSERNIAMVFQSYALYPHMSVRENIEFPLRMKGMPKQRRKEKVEEMAHLLGISHLLDAKPAQLSGGEKQRVALARALARDPALILMDEPLSNLDLQLRIRMRTEIKKLQRKTGTTVLYVTHDQTEALSLADRIMIMSEGRIVQIGTPKEIYECPKNEFVAGFIGDPPMNILRRKVFRENGKNYVMVGGEKFEVRDGKYEYISLGIRPSDIKVTGRGRYEIIMKEYVGDYTLLHLNFEGDIISVKVSSSENFREGERVDIKVEKIFPFYG